MADTSIGGEFRQRLLQLIDDLLSPTRSAMCETKSLGRLVAEIYCIDLGKARAATIYLKKLGYSGDAQRLKKDIWHLRKKANKALKGPVVAESTPNDQKQTQRDLGSLHHKVSDLVDFLRELESLVGHASNVGEEAKIQINGKVAPTPSGGQGKGSDNAGGASEADSYKVGSERDTTTESELLPTNANNSEGTAGQSPTKKRGLKPSENKAYGQWKSAIKRNPSLDGAKDKAVYDWVFENLLDDSETLPVFATWQRQLRHARNYYGQQKNQSRHGRHHGKSVVHEDQI